MWNVTCCEAFLDCEYLRYGDGNCELGAIFMHELGIIQQLRSRITDEGHYFKEKPQNQKVHINFN